MFFSFDDFMNKIRFEYALKDPTRSELDALGVELKTIFSTIVFDENVYRLARPGEELMYELCVDPSGGPSIYLVSDGAGVDTVPHEHKTWAIIVGVKGAEFNTFYKHADKERNFVTRSGACRIGEGDVLAMEAHEIHAIDSSLGIHPTYHVHLYGRSLSSLASFNSRCYTDGGCATVK